MQHGTREKSAAATVRLLLRAPFAVRREPHFSFISAREEMTAVTGLDTADILYAAAAESQESHYNALLLFAATAAHVRATAGWWSMSCVVALG